MRPSPNIFIGQLCGTILTFRLLCSISSVGWKDEPHYRLPDDFETDRYYLRRVEVDDAKAIFDSYATDAELPAFLAGNPITASQARPPSWKWRRPYGPRGVDFPWWPSTA